MYYTLGIGLAFALLGGIGGADPGRGVDAPLFLPERCGLVGVLFPLFPSFPPMRALTNSLPVFVISARRAKPRMST